MTFRFSFCEGVTSPSASRSSRGRIANLFVIRVGNRVTEWLREHIYRTDRILADWIKTHR